jgi:putative phage-type endonuclease
MNVYDLENIMDELLPEEHLFFNDDESMEIYDTCIHIMEEFIVQYPKLISEPDFEEIFDENIHELMHSHFDYDVFYNDEAEEEMEDIIDHAKLDFFKEYMPIRSYPNSIILKHPDHKYVTKQLNFLRNKPQPAQRTKEWYEFRHNLITASNAYKAFENQNVKNQLIYEKCQHLNPDLYVNDDECNEHDNDVKKIHVVQMVNTNSTLHWGQKYEPLSVKIYEHMYQTKIEDFGCIQHEKYMFLGASPDGINVDIKSERYGRMLEIKNIVNREIDGIPKKEYWIQMQLQMEVCDFDECDFLETRFVEYTDPISFYNDNVKDPVCGKGVIMHFHTKEGKPFYKYKPFDIIEPKDIDKWEEDMVDLYQSQEYGYMWIKNIYWKLDQLSCVLVCRNKRWFQDNIPELQEMWNIIEKERVSGFEHRAPNRKTKKYDETVGPIQNAFGCLLPYKGKTSANVNANVPIIVNKQRSQSLTLQDIGDVDVDL